MDPYVFHPSLASEAAMNAKVQEAVRAIRRRWNGAPRAGLILGTGLGEFAEHIEREVVIPYEEIPHFPCPRALSHKGQLVCGSAAGAPVVVMEGRCHIYEGHGLDDIALPVRVMRRLGAELLVASNATGGLNPKFASGDLMVIEDHINLMWRNPCGGVLPQAEGRLCRTGGAPYDRRLIERALGVARRRNFAAHAGVYVAMSGPNYETRAEYRFLRKIGGDVVGMSTVPEVIVAAHCGMRVLALSMVTNVARPDAPVQEKTTAEEVVAIASRCEPRMRAIVMDLLASERPREPAPVEEHRAKAPLATARLR